MRTSTRSITSDGGRFEAILQELSSASYRQAVVHVRFQHRNERGVEGSVVLWREVVALWQHDDEFTGLFIDVLAHGVEFEAFYFETPPVNIKRIEGDDMFRFECVIVESKPLAKVPQDVHTFAEYLEGPCEDSNVVVFPNLGGDAILVAPCPLRLSAIRDVECYAHLADFVRKAPRVQVRAFGRPLRCRHSDIACDPVR
eukprot:9485315-Pyramimonas_sp.AAC.3